MRQSFVLPGVAFHPLFSSDLDEAAEYLEARAGLGGALVDCVEEAILRIRKNPSLFHLDRKMEARKCLVRRFRYVIYFDYDSARNRVLIFVITHTSRRPSFWMNRLKAK